MADKQHILIVGDLIIDQTWLVGEPDPSEKFIAHYDVLPRNLIDPNRRTSVAGGIGTIARVLVTIIDIIDNYNVDVYGGWGKDFESLKEMYLPPEPDADKTRSINFVQIVEAELTRLISRIFIHDSKLAKLKLRNRFDQDINYLNHRLQQMSNWPSPNDVCVLILGDYGSGVLSNHNIMEKINEYSSVPTILRSKEKSLIDQLHWNILVMNLHNLAKYLEWEPFDTPTIKRFDNQCWYHPVLIDAMKKIINELLKDNNGKPKLDRTILLNLEKEGVLLLYHDYIYSLLINPDTQYDSPGVWASDVLIGNVANGLIKKIASGITSGTNLIKPENGFIKSTCLKAVEATQLFNSKALSFDHPNDGYAPDLKKWYIPRLYINPDANKLMPTPHLEKKAISEVIKTREYSNNFSLLRGSPKIELHWAEWYLSGFHTVDVAFGKEIVRLKNHIKEYLRDETPIRPFLSAICGNPGSGKSTLAEGIAKAVECEAICTNAAQWISVEDLFWVCEQIRSASMRKKVLLAFIDEVDARLRGEYIYGKLLAPVWDGAYFHRGEERRMGKAVFLLAGSTKRWRCFANLQKAAKDDESSKLLDLVSRLSAKPVDIPMLSPLRKADIIYLVAYNLRKRFPSIKCIQEGIFSLFCNSILIHGSRSIVKGIELFGPLKDPHVVQTNDLSPARMSSLELHIKLGQASSWRRLNRKIIIEQ